MHILSSLRNTTSLRNICLVLIDITLIFITLFLSFFFSNGSLDDYKIIYSLKFYFLSALTGIIIYFFSGQYNDLSRYFGSQAIYKLVLRNFIFVCTLAIYKVFIFKTSVHEINLFLFLFLIVGFSGFIRFLIRDYLNFRSANSNKSITRVAIYGAGNAGAQLASSLKLSRKYQILTFIDDSKKLWGMKLNGIPIISPKNISKFSKRIDQVLLAIPSLDDKRRFKILNYLQNQKLSSLTIPSFDELSNGEAQINTLKPIIIDELLGREVVIPNQNLLIPSVKNQSVMITGAGGSIGSELCREILKLHPLKIVLLEHSEANLYNISLELNNNNFDNINIKSCLGNACDKRKLDKIFIEEKIDIVFHAAAYKHVPLVEENPLSGLNNNVFSTFEICKSAQKNQVKKVILISTDKAVRPSNVMGASKRLAELVVQAFSASNYLEKSNVTQFSIVRFGNVLDSSGSVVPLFRKQIQEGGPITLTHPEIIRYFMTIKEAAQLVLQSSFISKGGEVFLLDMGNPVKIKKLAEQMILFNGKTIKDNDNPSGDIEIKITGLRPGEKLYEELLIDAKSEKTIHPLIYKAKEKYIEKKVLFPEIDLLKKSIENQDIYESLKTLKKLVKEWEYKKIRVSKTISSR